MDEFVEDICPDFLRVLGEAFVRDFKEDAPGVLPVVPLADGEEPVLVDFLGDERDVPFVVGNTKERDRTVEEEGELLVGVHGAVR